MTAPTRQRLTDVRGLFDADHIGPADFADGLGGYTREYVLEIADVGGCAGGGKPRAWRSPRPRAGEKIKRIEIAFRHGDGRPAAKTWLSGPVTRQILIQMLGPFVERWIGRRITLYYDTSVMFGRERVGGVRVRPTVPGGSVQTTDDPLDAPVDVEGAAKREAAVDAAYAAETPPEPAAGRQPGED